MKRMRRVVMTTVLGVIAGLVCYLLSKNNFEYTKVTMWTTILNRTLLGFAIGISGLKWNYVIHGIIVGAIMSLPLAIPALFNSTMGFILLLVAGAVYGLIIEIITSGLFKFKK